MRKRISLKLNILEPQIKTIEEEMRVIQTHHLTTMGFVQVEVVTAQETVEVVAQEVVNE